MSKQREAFYHHWALGESYLLIHHSTGLRIFCEPKEAPADNPDDNWHAYIIDIHADRQRLATQDDTSVDEYTEYLARSAMELIDKFVKDMRRENSEKP